MSRRASILIFVAALVVIDALARFVTGSSPSLVDEATPLPATPVAEAFAASLRDEFAPLLARAAEDAGALVELGETKDRNLLRIRASQRAMEQSLSAADAWLAANPTPPDAVQATMTYREGVEEIRAAMAEAQAGFLRLDFDRVARATAKMREGERLLRDAVTKLGATPG